MVTRVMAMANIGKDDNNDTVDDTGRPSWAWPTNRVVTPEEDEAWTELEARLRLSVVEEECK